jgi:hypothetical protein
MTDQHDDEQEPKIAFGKWITTQRDRGESDRVALINGP